jgi:hypothetical protein
LPETTARNILCTAALWNQAPADRVTFSGATGDRGLKAEHVKKGGASHSGHKEPVQEESEDENTEDDSDSEDNSEDE